MSDLNQYLSLQPGTKLPVYCCKNSKKTAVVFRDEDKVSFWCARCGRSEFLRVRRSLNWIKNLSHKFTSQEEIKKLPPDMTEALDSKTLEWLGKYGVPAHDAIQRGVRYSEILNRAVLLVKDESGEVQCAQFRALEAGQEPKYMTTVLQGKETMYRPALFTMNPRSRTLVLTEDILSAIKVDIVPSKTSMYGLSGADVDTCALLGTHLSTEGAHKIASLADECWLWFDNDDAGLKACKQVKQKLELFEIPCKIILSEKDPKAHSRAEIQEILNRARTERSPVINARHTVITSPEVQTGVQQTNPDHSV